MDKMQHLSAMDSAFLHLETAEMPMHVGALHVFEIPPGQAGKFVTRLRAHIASRLPALAKCVPAVIVPVPMNPSRVMGIRLFYNKGGAAISQIPTAKPQPKAPCQPSKSQPAGYSPLRQPLVRR